MNKCKLDTLIREHCHAMVALFNQCGEMDTHAIVVGSDGHEYVLSPRRLRDTDDKNIFADVIRKVAKDTEALGIINVAVGWMSMRAPDDGPPTCSPSKDPERKEILAIMIETWDRTVSRVWPILRDGDKPYLGDELTGVGDTAVGRFVGLLRRPEHN